MEKFIDFTDCKEEINEYKGSEKKKTLIYDNRKFLVKFPDPLRQKNKNISYINNAFSEYIGSHIFEICGFRTQKTILGKYNTNGKEKIVCACEDFIGEDEILYEFENLTNSSMIDKKIDTEINDILSVLDENKNIIDVNNTIQNFWRMFIIDSLIGNTDRHNGNWGFIKKKLSGEILFSPIFDCGSCLNPLLDDKDLEKINEPELKNLVLNCYSCLKDSGKKINYFSYMESNKNDDCIKALLYVFEKIDMARIEAMINEIENISDVRKRFYIDILSRRYGVLKSIVDNIK